jgi:cell wall-associated NlpC family hydrolase
MDRRITPYSGRVAHVSLKGKVEAPLTQGEAARVALPLAPLLRAPGGALDRTLLYGDVLTVIDRRDGHVFVLAAKDGYCGWLDKAAVTAPEEATHRVALPATHLYPEPRVQATPLHPLYLNSRVRVLSDDGKWAETTGGYVFLGHVAPLDRPAAGPVEVARMFLHAPYLWGGNAVSGLDCSGLAQLSLHAAGKSCPGDSDLQQAVGDDVPEDMPLQCGDLIFWKGHVALMTGPDRIIHATGFAMAVIEEDLARAVARIVAQGNGPVVARRRP